MSARLAQDHQAVLFPDTETAFVDTDDVVKRLLPYHVFQLPKDDIGKGKAKATEIEEIKGWSLSYRAMLTSVRNQVCFRMLPQTTSTRGTISQGYNSTWQGRPAYYLHSSRLESV